MKQISVSASTRRINPDSINSSAVGLRSRRRRALTTPRTGGGGHLHLLGALRPGFGVEPRDAGGPDARAWRRERQMLYRRDMRGLFVLPLLLLVCCVAGCGDSGSEALRIDLKTFVFDGDLPDELRLRRLDPGPDEGSLYDLRPVPGGRRGEYEAAGAPDGNYGVEGPEGWWMLSEGGVPARLARGFQPPLVALGRGRSLYLASRNPDVRPSTVWRAVRLRPGGAEEPVPIRVEADERGYVVALRFAPEDWRGTLQVFGRIAAGPPPTPPAGPDAPLAEPMQFEVSSDARPRVIRVRSTDSGPLEVVLVPASEDVSTEGLRVLASTEGLPVPSAFEAFGRRGIARLAAVPIVDRMLRVEVEGQAGHHLVAPEVRRRQANLRLLVTGDLPLERVRALAEPEVDDDLRVDLVLVRPGGAVAYGRVPFEPVQGGVAFAVPRGAVSILMRSGTRWASATGQSEGGMDLYLQEADFREGVVVGGSVDGAPPGAVVRFFQEVDQGGQAVLGDGFEVRVEHSGAFEAHLPTGRYLVEVAARTGVWRRPAPLIAESPGARLHLPLESP